MNVTAILALCASVMIAWVVGIRGGPQAGDPDGDKSCVVLCISSDPLIRNGGRKFRKQPRAAESGGGYSPGMICSWRKSPTAPCSCAYRLRGPLSELLNHLCCLGQATLVLRQQGLSLAKATTFGLSVAYSEEAWHVLHDRLSGLETDTHRAFGVYLIADACDRRPMLAMAELGRPIHLSIHLEGRPWDSPVVKTLIDHFQGVSLDCMESRRLGAGAWLDEWERPVNPDCDTSIVRGACQILHECRELEVDVNSRGCRGTACFELSFVDSAGTVIRITDRERRHVVHADVNDPGFHLSRTKGSGLRLAVSA